MRFQEATNRRIERFRQGRHKGYRVKLSTFPGCDVQMDVVFAIDAGNNELLVEVRDERGP